MIVEICCTSTPSLKNAIKGGASRLEICEHLMEDGLTPSPTFLQEVIETTRLPINVLIRPRRGNFTYSYEEIKTVEEQIEWAQSMGVQGVVIGALNEDRSLPLPVLKKWVATAKSMNLTFHRAFDRVIHAEESLKKIIDLGFNRVLTSGQQQTALQGIGLLNKLNQIAQGKLVVMPGGGINEQNCDLFFKEGFDEIHLSGKGKEKTALGEPIADLNTIRKVVACAQQYQQM